MIVLGAKTSQNQNLLTFDVSLTWSRVQLASVSILSSHFIHLLSTFRVPFYYQQIR